MGRPAGRFSGLGDVITVPADFAQEYAEREGESGRQWIESLPHVIDELCQKWELTLGDEIRTGHVGIVCFAERGQSEVALKVSYPYDDTAHEGDVLAAWGGDGAVRLLEQDRCLQALLMERLDERSLDDEPLDEAISVIARLWEHLQSHRPPEGLGSTNDAARGWVTRVPDEWANLGGDLQTDERLLLHGDLHYDNVMRGRGQWLAVDPKCFVGDPCFEAVAPLWNRLEEITGDRDEGIRARHRRICELGGLDVVRAAKWSILHGLEEGDSHAIVPALAVLL